METFYPKSGDWNTVGAAFHAHTVAELTLLARAAALPSEGRKAERIAELCRALEGDALRTLWERLSPGQRAGVADAVTADPRTAKHCVRAGETLLVVPLDREGKFYRALRTVGFGAGSLRGSEKESE